MHVSLQGQICKSLSTSLNEEATRGKLDAKQTKAASHMFWAETIAIALHCVLCLMQVNSSEGSSCSAWTSH